MATKIKKRIANQRQRLEKGPNGGILLLLIQYVEYLGEVPFEKKVELMQNAKAVVVPNVYRLPLKDGKGYAEFPEPFGLVPIEAAAVGSPVVSSPIYGLTETLIHGLNGFHANSIDEFIYYLKNSILK